MVANSFISIELRQNCNSSVKEENSLTGSMRAIDFIVRKLNKIHYLSHHGS